MLSKLRQKVQNASNQVDVQLQRKFDLTPNLEKLVKNYTSKANSLIKKSKDLRASWQDTKNIEEKFLLSEKLSYIIKSLTKTLYDYPDLKIDDEFISIHSELNSIEDTISFSKQFYNDISTKYNNKISLFPYIIVAKIFKFEKEELSIKKSKAIKLDFE